MVQLKKTKYQEANFLHFQELLEKHEGIRLSYSAIHKILTENDIKSPKNTVSVRPTTGEKDLKIRNIDTLEAANAFLPEFIIDYNKKFAVEPENPQPAFRPLNPDINLDYILCIKEKRTIKIRAHIYVPLNFLR